MSFSCVVYNKEHDVQYELNNLERLYLEKYRQSIVYHDQDKPEWVSAM